MYEAIAALCKPGPRGHSITQNRWKDRQLAKDLCERADAFGVGDTSAHRMLRRWYAHRYALAVSLARSAAAEFADHRIRLGKLDFQDLLVLTAQLLRENPRVRRSLGERYRRLLVDEFQDTDPLQAEIVMLLASPPDASEENAEVDADPMAPAWWNATPRPGALFVVGDPKQSIYRFRRADIQLYGMVKARFRDFGKVLELTTNFRSRPPIGDLVNQHFSRPGSFPPQETAEQARFEPLNTRPPESEVPTEGVFTYTLSPKQANQVAAAEDDAVRLASWIRGRVDAGERVPRDFMILTRQRARLEIYARALEAQRLPVQVTGAGVGVEEEVRELEVLLECLIDPANSVAVVAALVGLFFGLDYERLVQHRLEGGAFNVMRPGDRGHPDVVEALNVLNGWWLRANEAPADAFLAELMSELGLLPFAAAGELGSLRAGAMVYVLDTVRAAALAGEASLPGALAALGAALGLPEAEAPLEPGRDDVVRVMNLHQAKGLEATVVVLADPSGARHRPSDMHVERSGHEGARGFVRVTEGQAGFRRDRVLAEPDGWAQKQEIEDRFDAAEEVRLLYVAVTRAREELVVARWGEGREPSPWQALDAWLDEHASELEMEPSAPAPPRQLEVDAMEVDGLTASAAERLESASTPSYSHRTVTSATKADLGEEEHRAFGTGDARAGRDEFRGYSWGSAVHGALAAAAGTTDRLALRATCRDLLVENERPVDDHGDPRELEELLELVAAVRDSSLWRRAGRAKTLMVEVPFAVTGLAAEAEADPQATDVAGRPQLDLFGAPTQAPEPEGVTGGTDGAPEVIEGVIDLAFLEADGWVIADYKTDLGTDPDFQRRRASYRRQVDLYAKAWGKLTGAPVKERVLFFTAQGKLEKW